MNFLNRLEKKIGRYAIPGLMKYMVGCYVIGYIIMYAAPNLVSWLTLEPYMIFHQGQVWRLVSWLLIPPSRSYLIFAIIMIIFYYQIGTALEHTWGVFRFNVFIFGGIIFTILGALLLYFATGQAPLILQGAYYTTYYLNLSIFLAFAVCYPDQQVMLYFLIPVRMKWLAIVYAVLAVAGAVSGGVVSIVAIAASLANFLIFFLLTRNYHAVSPQEIRRKQSFRRQMNRPSGSYRSEDGRISKHKCAVCGRTELDDPNLEFRFCSKCNGNYEYCQDHLFTHKHVK
ncbi:hypothetical protein CXIVA_21430 [Clostridium sp. SY8519]|uniref:membrane protein n=1 Tax=Clostridium sp. (strain SY8519) TaxID=1042156 RepID=UPI0002171B05|nr:membrane protein [Clostridium sp. SY8519]BAK48110.1 hypothetical protein CXIVA_21430 [Clostridium sp. SY8519]